MPVFYLYMDKLRSKPQAQLVEAEEIEELEAEPAAASM
jgi:hypothetical protein